MAELINLRAARKVRERAKARAEAAEAVELPKSTLQWHVSQRGGVRAVREAVPA